LVICRSKKNGLVEGIETAQNSLYCKQALVVATGAWTGSFLQSLVLDPDVVLHVPVKPRKVPMQHLNRLLDVLIL